MDADLMRHLSDDSMKVDSIREEHLLPCIALWAKQFKHANAVVQNLPEKWITDSKNITLLLKEHVEKNRGIVVEAEGDVVGYMVYNRLPFHGVDTMYSPIMGHATIEPGKTKIYQKMYEHLSDLWVKSSVLDHMVTFFAPDTGLRDTLFHLGFGLYAVDAFRSAESSDSEEGTSILKASLDNIEDLLRLAEESRLFYRRPPIFLVREKIERGTWEDLVRSKEAAVFIVEHEGKTVGFMGVKKSDADDAFTLVDKSTGTVGGLGAYIHPSYRGREFGARLLSRVVDWCKEHRLDHIHVDYESANHYANGFWPKHFTPTMYTVKRRVNQDIQIHE
jgi:GNAT superfamily N-acetyltransferase